MRHANKQKLKIGIIGAGPAGLTAGYILSKQGHHVDIYEKSESPGGMCKTLDLWGQRVDLGPHRFFSKNESVNKLWLEIAQGDYEVIDRMTRIYYNNRFFNYPLLPFNVLKNLGVLESSLCILDYLKQKVRQHKEADNFEDYVIQGYGYRLYDTFFKTYTEKLWGIPCTELSAEWARQRIRKLSFSDAIVDTIKALKKPKAKSDKFLHPTRGTGEIYNRMAGAIKDTGGNIFFNAKITEVQIANRKVEAIGTKQGLKPYDHIISTMPITNLIEGLTGIQVPPEVTKAAHSLTYRNTILIFLEVKSARLFPDQWIYIHSKETPIERITNFRNWSAKMRRVQDTTIVAVELFCYSTDDIWAQSDDKISELAINDLKKIKLVNPEQVTNSKVIKLEKSYPIFKLGYKEHLTKIESFLNTIKNLHVIGRTGAFKYNNQDHSILMGLLASDNILENTRHNLWTINTDTQYQEENLSYDRW